MNNKNVITIQDVALRAEVSAMTVSRVLNDPDRVAPETRQRIERVIDELGYIPNALARGLIKGNTRMIGLIVGDITNPFWTEVASGAEEIAHRNGYAVVLGNVGDSPEKSDEIIQMMIGNRADGLIINTTSQKSLNSLFSRVYPVVLIGSEYKGIKADVVVGDNYHGAQVLTRHLLELGHRRIALINGPKHSSEVQYREQGYKHMLQEYGLELTPQWIVEGDFKRHGGYAPAQKLLSVVPEQRPTAIVASNNFIALGVIEAAREMGLRIPEDVALVCFDDFEMASTIYPFLTVMAQPARTYGVQAVQLLIDRLNNPEKWRPSRVVFTPDLIVRRSCGARLSDSRSGAAVNGAKGQ